VGETPATRAISEKNTLNLGIIFADHARRKKNKRAKYLGETRKKEPKRAYRDQP